MLALFLQKIQCWFGLRRQNSENMQVLEASWDFGTANVFIHPTTTLHPHSQFRLPTKPKIPQHSFPKGQNFRLVSIPELGLEKSQRYGFVPCSKLTIYSSQGKVGLWPPSSHYRFIMFRKKQLRPRYVGRFLLIQLIPQYTVSILCP